MSGKYALIIGNTEYTDPGLAQLSAPGKDAEDFARVLKDKEIGAFDTVKIIVNEPSVSVIEAIDEFFDQKKPDDMLVLYFSGHGIRDEIGSLYLAFKNTIRSRLRSTAIKSDYIREAMDQSRSKRQVLILDCCNSGAFHQGTKAEIGGTMGMTQAFQGYGRFVLTASDATQFAWEGDQVIGETDNSLFTHFLVKGLEGEADNDGDGRITVDELYDYAYDQISRVTPKQTPTKSSSKVEGEIVLRQSTNIEDIKPVPLPKPLLDSIENPFSDIRLGAVQQLTKLINGKNLGLARSAKEALERISKEDDSRQVSNAALQTLEIIRQTEKLALQKTNKESLDSEKLEVKRGAKKEADRLVKQNTGEERIARVKMETDRPIEKKWLVEEKANQKAEEERTTKEKYIAAVKKPTKTSWLTFGAIGGGIIGLALCGLAATRFLPIIFAGATTVTTNSAPPTTEPLATQAIHNTQDITPTKTLRVVPSTIVDKETYVYINVETAFLYKGPGKGYEVASFTKYTKGDKFEVLAIDKSGFWLLCTSSDNNITGWLFLDWVDISVNPSIIPTASYIPPVPTPAPTRRNKPSH